MTPRRQAGAAERLEPAAAEADRHLDEAYADFDLLLLVTPVNGAAAWAEFRRARFERAPAFAYRPLGFDPAVSKRTLFAVPIDRVEDPLLATLLRERQEELDRQISLVASRETPAFRHASLMLYGDVEPSLVATAERLLAAPAELERQERSTLVTAEELAAIARREIAAYRATGAPFPGEVELRDDVPAGLVVSRGRLLVARDWTAPRRRALALIAHEVGTHMLTWANATLQPLRLLRAGTAGYDTLQEGLASLAEYLVGGMSAARMRIFGGRVLACRSVAHGADFVETFRLLRQWGFDGYVAFTIALRVHRGGGFTKDVIYLRGIAEVLAHLAAGGELVPLLAGKMATRHIPAVAELTRRGLLAPPRLRPRHLDAPGATERLVRLRRGATPDMLAGVAEERA